jgi:hypothetical protein
MARHPPYPPSGASSLFLSSMDVSPCFSFPTARMPSLSAHVQGLLKRRKPQPSPMDALCSSPLAVHGRAPLQKLPAAPFLLPPMAASSLLLPWRASSRQAPAPLLHADTPCSSSLYRRPPQNSKFHRPLHLPWKTASPHRVLVFSLLSLASRACCQDTLAAAPTCVLPAHRYAQPAACGHAGVLRSACATPPIYAAPTSHRRNPR